MPAEQGGLGLGYLHHCIAMEELSRASGSGECCDRCCNHRMMPFVA